MNQTSTRHSIEALEEEKKNTSVACLFVSLAKHQIKENVCKYCPVKKEREKKRLIYKIKKNCKVIS